MVAAGGFEQKETKKTKRKARKKSVARGLGRRSTAGLRYLRFLLFQNRRDKTASWRVFVTLRLP